MRRPIRVACGVATVFLLATAAHAGSYIPRTGATWAAVVHAPGYYGRGGVLPLRVCLRSDSPLPNGDPRVAIRNALATLNRRQSMAGNVVVGNEQSIDFESMALHEIGHCLGMGHNAIGPSEATAYGTGDGGLYFANALPGNNAVMQVFDGGDGVRGTLDDQRGDDLNINWFAAGLNDPFAQPGTVVDRQTYSTALTDLPAGHTFAEIASSFAPCRAPDSEPYATQSSALRSQPRTQSIMYPVLCIPHRIRELAPEDEVQLRLASAGLDGLQGSSDDYLPRLSFHDATNDCEIDLRFADGEGFAFCTVEFAPPAANGDQRIRRATATFDRASFWNFTTLATGNESSVDLWLNGHAADDQALPGNTVQFMFQVGVPATATAQGVMLLAEQGSEVGMHVVASDPVVCDALPCMLGDLTPGLHTFRLSYRLDAELTVGALLRPRFAIVAGGHDPDGENNRLVLEIVVADPDPTRILRSGFEGGERSPAH